MIHEYVKQDIKDAVFTAIDYDADWRGEDYVGYICTQKDLDINSQEIIDIVKAAQEAYYCFPC